MEISQREVGEATVVELSGDVDMHSSPEARRAFLALIDAKTPKIVVDLSNVTYIDSSGLATLVECVQGLSKYDGALRLVGVNEKIRDVFLLARLDKVFDIRDDLDAAVQS